MTLLDALKEIPIKDRIFYGVVLAIVVAGLAIQPAWRLVDPNFAEVAEFIKSVKGHSSLGPLLDPWGRNLQVSHGRGVTLLYSLGPDETSSHDDIRLPHDRVDAFNRLPDALFALAALLAIAWEGIRGARVTLGKPRGSLLVELRRAAALGVVPAVLLFGVSWWVLILVKQSAPGVVESAREALLVPLPVALAGSAFGVATLGILYLRTREASASST